MAARDLKCPATAESPTVPPVPPTDRLLAWVDESGSDHARDPNTYLFAAAVGWQHQVDLTRDRLRALKLPGAKKLHWRDDSDARHRVVAAGVAALPGLEHLVVVRAAGTPERDERQRSKALQVLLCELSALGAHVCLESRGKKADNRDVQTLGHLRRRGHLPDPIRIDHQPGPAEPMLWIPDAVCGMVVEMRCGTPTYFNQIRGRTTIIPAS